VERGVVPPNATELLAYGFVFGCTPQSLFPAYAEEIEDAVMARAYPLSQRLEGDGSPNGRRKSELLQNMLARVTTHAPTL
jgi:hypothetical protein